MPYDERLANRLRRLLRGDYSVVEKKMFGGLAFMVNGHMCCGVVRSDLVVRIGPDSSAEVLNLPHARPMDFTGRPMKGFVYVSPEGYRRDSDLRAWTQRGLDFVFCLKPK